MWPPRTQDLFVSGLAVITPYFSRKLPEQKRYFQRMPVAGVGFYNCLLSSGQLS
jgi:hypothetical protein